MSQKVKSQLKPAFSVPTTDEQELGRQQSTPNIFKGWIFAGLAAIALLGGLCILGHNEGWLDTVRVLAILLLALGALLCGVVWSCARTVIAHEKLSREGETFLRNTYLRGIRGAQQDLANELEVARRLHEVSMELIQADHIEALYEKILDTGVAIMRSDFASLQMLYPERGNGGELRLLSSRGFTEEAIKYWEWVTPKSHCACGMAFRTRRTIMVPDVQECEFIAGTQDLEVFVQAGIRAAQATPLISRTGVLLGMLSVQWRHPHEPTPAETCAFEVLARQAADLIDRKRADDTVRAISAELQCTMDTAAIGLTHCSRDLRYLSVNRAYSELVGLPAEKIVGRPIVDVIGQAGYEVIHPYVERVLRGEQVRYEKEIPYVGSGSKISSVTYSPERDAEGKVIGWVASVVDITSQKRAEEALRRSESLLRIFSESSPDPIFIKDRQGRQVLANPATLAVMGKSSEAVLGKTDMEIFDDSKTARTLMENDREVMELGCTRVMEETVVTPQGERTYLVTKTPHKGNNGEVIGLIGMAQDITDRKRIENDLRIAEERFRRLCDGNILGIVIADQERITFANEEFLTLLGYSREDLLGGRIKWQDFTPADQSASESHRLKELKEKGATPPVEREFIHRDGGRVPVLTGASVLRKDPLTWICFVLDITERKAAQEILARSREQLEDLVTERTEKLQELVGELEHFSCTITHDMRAPLRAMRSYAEVVQELAEPEQQEERKAMLQRIISAADRMDLLITDALSYSKAVREELPVGPVDANALLRGMLDSYPEYQVSKAHIKLCGDIPLVLGNQAGLTQSFSNLLGNAVKFARPGIIPEICVRSEAVSNAAIRGANAPGHPRRFSTERPEHWVRIWVEDNGIGIPSAMLPRIFDMFSRESNNYEGTGIGLALVRKVVERMGGHVGAESTVGQGSRFWIELPAAEPAHRRINDLLYHAVARAA